MAEPRTPRPALMPALTIAALSVAAGAVALASLREPGADGPPADASGGPKSGAVAPPTSSTLDPMSHIYSRSGYDITPLPRDRVAELAKALTPEQTITSAHLGTTGQRVQESVLQMTNIDSMADLDALILKITRKASSDTMTGDAFLLDVLVRSSSEPPPPIVPDGGDGGMAP